MGPRPKGARSTRGARHKKAPDDAGAFELQEAQSWMGSGLSDHPGGLGEAVDQRGADGLVPGIEADVAASRQEGAVEELGVVLRVVESRAIFGLHEPAGRGDAEDIGVVLDAAADEEAASIERVGVNTSRSTAN